MSLNNAYAAMTMDVIFSYRFGQSLSSLARPEYGKNWLDMLHSGIQMRPPGRQFLWHVNALPDIPLHVISKVNADMAHIATWTFPMLPKIEAILAGIDVRDGNVERTVFHEIRDGKISAAEREPMRLMVESSGMLGAGTATSRTLAVTTYYLTKHRDIGDELRRGLRTVLPKPESLVELAKLKTLPYLGGVVNEGLRLAHGVSQRQPRIATEEDLVYKQ